MKRLLPMGLLAFVGLFSLAGCGAPAAAAPAAAVHGAPAALASAADNASVASPETDPPLSHDGACQQQYDDCVNGGQDECLCHNALCSCLTHHCLLTKCCPAFDPNCG